MLETIAKISGKHDAGNQERLLQEHAKADSVVVENIRQVMQHSALHYITAEGHGSLDKTQLVAFLEQELCSHLQSYPAERQRLDLDKNATRRLLVIAIYGDVTAFAIADCTFVSNRVVAVLHKYSLSDKAGRFAEQTVATVLMESFSCSNLHIAPNLSPEMFLPAARRIFNMASHAYLPEGIIEESIVYDGMPVEFTVHLKDFHTSELLLPLLGVDGKLSTRLKRFFSESLVFPSSLHGIICTGSYASNTWLHRKLMFDFKLPLFLFKTGAYLNNPIKKQSTDNCFQFNSFTLKSDPVMTPAKEEQLKKEKELEKARQIVQKEIMALSEQRQKYIESMLYVDPTTRLQWVRDANLAGKKMTWHEARKWVSTLEYAGYKDWRLPAKEELAGFAAKGGKRPSEWFNSNGFTHVQASNYWSSSTYAIGTSHAWYVYMDYGGVGSFSKGSNYYVWPVRSRQ